MASFKALGGTSDIFPEEAEAWQRMEDQARRILRLYSYREIRTPILEEAAVFTRSLGEAAEIVTKQMYFLQERGGRGGRSVVLRPEGTASVVRAFIEQGLDKTAGVSRFYYLGPMFRAERPQAGRRRQFHQLGVEVFGSASPYQDAEVMALLMCLIRGLGVKTAKDEADGKSAVLKLNHLGCRNCRPEWVKKLKSDFAECLSQLCEECRERFLINPLRILDCKNERCRGRTFGMAAASKRLCASCGKNAEQVKAVLEGSKDQAGLGVYFEWDNRLVRGLDYYTGMVFEVIHTGLGEKAQSAIAAGGRYDNLVEEMGGASVPAVGFAVGLERIRMVQEAEGDRSASGDAGKATGRVFIATVSPQEIPAGLLLADQLRAEGVEVLANLEERPLKRQMEQASKWAGQGRVLILGEEELRSGKVTIRTMSTGEQERVRREEVVGRCLQLAG